MIYRKLIVLASLLIGFVNIAFAGVGDLDTLNVRSQAPVKERMPVVAYKFNPKSLILPASLITVGAVGTAIDGAWAEELGKRASPGRGALFVSVRTYLECFLRGAYGL